MSVRKPHVTVVKIRGTSFELNDDEVDGLMSRLWSKGFRPDGDGIRNAPGAICTMEEQYGWSCWLEVAGITVDTGDYENYLRLVRNPEERLPEFLKQTGLTEAFVRAYVDATTMDGSSLKWRCQALTKKGTRCTATPGYADHREFDQNRPVLCRIHADRTMNVKLA